jgi:Uma2 family endonuclease
MLPDAPLRSPDAEPSLMGMSHAAERWTPEMVRALPDDGHRYELISGELVVTPAPRALHQVAVSTLEALLRQPAEDRGAHLLHSPADIALGEDEILQPDLFACRTASGRPPVDWGDISALLLVIEVVSPSSARDDRTVKRIRYQRARVPDYWVADVSARAVERWRPDSNAPEVLTDRIEWTGFPIDLPAMFRSIFGEDAPEG